MKAFLATLFSLTILAEAKTKFADCDFVKDADIGPYGPATFFNITFDETVIYGLIPKGKGPFPLVGFMHGSTGEYGMYD
jgi:hypothetical protein